MNDTTTANAGELIITRTYDAPRELVFECMVRPEHLTHFWGPVGVTTPLDRITIDLRPGGTFDTVMVNDSDGAEFASHAVYIEIDDPAKLVWSESGVEGGMTTSVTFTDLGDGRTEVVIHQTNVPEMHRTPEAQAGFHTSLDRFASYLTSL
jgi:uncharacterized protein YndB with AHSA1/START domain